MALRVGGQSAHRWAPEPPVALLNRPRPVRSARPAPAAHPRRPHPWCPPCSSTRSRCQQALSATWAPIRGLRIDVALTIPGAELSLAAGGVPREPHATLVFQRTNPPYWGSIRTWRLK